MSSTEFNHDSEGVNWWWCAPLLVLLALLLLLDLAIATVFEVDSETAAGLVIGSMFAQIVVAAVWIALGPMAMLPRVMMGASLIFVSTLSMFVCALRDAGDEAIAFVLAGAMLVQAILYQIPLWVARYQGWQLTLPGGAPQSNPRQEFQFGLRQLLIWTTVVAVLLAGGRLLLSSFSVEAADFAGDGAGLFAVFSLFSVLLAFPIIWGCFVRQLVWLWLLMAVLWCCALTVAEFWVLETMGLNGDDEIFVLANVAQLLAATTTLLCVRLAGFRLKHRDELAASG